MKQNSPSRSHQPSAPSLVESPETVKEGDEHEEPKDLWIDLQPEHDNSITGWWKAWILPCKLLLQDWIKHVMGRNLAWTQSYATGCVLILVVYLLVMYLLVKISWQPSDINATCPATGVDSLAISVAWRLRRRPPFTCGLDERVDSWLQEQGLAMY